MKNHCVERCFFFTPPLAHVLEEERDSFFCREVFLIFGAGIIGIQCRITIGKNKQQKLETTQDDGKQLETGYSTFILQESARGATAAHQAPHKDTSRAKDVQVPVQHAERLFSRPPTVRVRVILEILRDHTQSTAQSKCSNQSLSKCCRPQPFSIILRNEL